MKNGNRELIYYFNADGVHKVENIENQSKG